MAGKYTEKVRETLEQGFEEWKRAGTVENRAECSENCANLVEKVGAEAKNTVEKETGTVGNEADAEVSALCQIALRKQLMEKKLPQAGFLVDVAISLVLKGFSVPVELPFLLFEDLFQSISVEHFNEAWGLLEARTKDLTRKEMLPYHKVTKAKMAMLRIANFMLRRLSASHHTVLCGRVMMFLAYAFPLSERSGVNLLGAYNDINVTDFEDENTFNSSLQEEEPAVQSDSERKDDEPLINYTLYQKFWGLQKFFMSKAEKPNSGILSKVENWDNFTQVSNLVLSAFESKPFSQADLDREMVQLRENKRRKKSVSVDGMDIADLVENKESDARNFFPTKYLSSGRLLKLQLSDPTLRRNVLVQFMFLFQHITRIMKPQSGVDVNAAVRRKVDDAQNGLGSMSRRVVALLRATPPDGETFLGDLMHVLVREDKWIDWKAARCPDFERHSERGEEGGNDEEKTDEQEAARARAKSSQLARANEKIKRNRTLWRSSLQDWKSELSSIEPPAEFNEFIRSMEIAIDPDNCIEDDYHPKHDNVYCWQGLRLLARDNLNIMQKVEDGSLENATKKIMTLRTGRTFETKETGRGDPSESLNEKMDETAEDGTSTHEAGATADMDVEKDDKNDTTEKDQEETSEGVTETADADQEKKS